MRFKMSKQRRVFLILNYAFFTLFCLTIILPFMNIIAISLSGHDAVVRGVGFLPKDLNFSAYLRILTNWGFLRSFINSVGLTVINTVLTITLSVMCGYVLASKYMVGKRVLFIYLVIPMYFNGGIIPLFVVVNKLKLTDNFLAMILPVVVSSFYIFIFRNNIMGLPKDIMESAEVDGAGELLILRKVVVPLLLPVITAFAVMSAVTFWNEWYYCMLFMRSSEKWTLQYMLKSILAQHEVLDAPNSPFRMYAPAVKLHGNSVRMAALMVSVLPIVMVYPFMQKYFIHGIVVGAVKG